MLANKVALVTGAGSGIGESIAKLYAENGAKVVCADIDEKGAQGTVQAIKSNGGDAIFVNADVSKAEDCEKMVQTALDEFGELDIACNNAGIGGPSAPIGEYPLDGWEKVININLNGVFYGMRYQIPAMLQNGGGVIINMASILGQVGFAGNSAYVAAKHGVVGLTQNAALEYASQGIRVNTVAPGFIKTPLLEENLTSEQMQQITALHPAGRMGEPAEVAELVLWLSSDKAAFANGGYYELDGGYLAR